MAIRVTCISLSNLRMLIIDKLFCSRQMEIKFKVNANY